MTTLSSAVSKRSAYSYNRDNRCSSFLALQKVLEVDTREAQRLGLLRPLVRREIEKHFADFGLEPEFVSHNTTRGLSGGQKVKIVLGAATWRRPHVICLDEPTSEYSKISSYHLIILTTHMASPPRFTNWFGTLTLTRHSNYPRLRTEGVSMASIDKHWNARDLDLQI